MPVRLWERSAATQPRSELNQPEGFRFRSAGSIEAKRKISSEGHQRIIAATKARIRQEGSSEA